MGLLDRISDAGRTRLLTWLTSESAARDDDSVSRMVARVVGTDGGAEAVARQAFAVLQPLLLETYATPRSLDPEVPPGRRVRLAHRRAGARHRLHGRRTHDRALLLELVFDERFARYARRAVVLQGRRLSPVDATSVARPGPTVGAVWSPAGRPVHPARLGGGADPREREARARRGAGTPARRDPRRRRADTGRLAMFPDLYLDRVIASLRERLDRRPRARRASRGALGRHHRARRRARRTSASRGSAWTGSSREARFADAVDAQAAVLAILSQRAYDDDAVYSWRRIAPCSTPGAARRRGARRRRTRRRAYFVRARRDDPYGPARAERVGARARADRHRLETALGLAERAIQLERRLGDRVSYDNADALALVLLELGRFEEAAAVIEPILRRVERQPDPGGRYHLRAAEARLGERRRRRRARRDPQGAAPRAVARRRHAGGSVARAAGRERHGSTRSSEGAEEALAPTIE